MSLLSKYTQNPSYFSLSSLLLPIFLCWIVPIAAQLAFLVLLAVPPASSILNTATTVILLKVHQILVALTILFQFLQGLINSLAIKAKVLKLAYMSL